LRGLLLGAYRVMGSSSYRIARAIQHDEKPREEGAHMPSFQTHTRLILALAVLALVACMVGGVRLPP
jgi:hypothetical protein